MVLILDLWNICYNVLNKPRHYTHVSQPIYKVSSVSMLQEESVYSICVDFAQFKGITF